ncbi:MAG: FAD-dependent oxidoreductase [Pseudomonadota bacterium]
MAKRPDVLVIGAGIFGLWTALCCARAGMQVICVDRDQPGAGASGGLVGALTPHMPVRWRPLKQFQFDALMSLGEATDRLTEESGLPTGYVQSGRLSPLVDQRARDRAEEHVHDARTHWQDLACFEVLENSPATLRGFLPQESCPNGLVHDTVSGRVSPRLYIAALAEAVRKKADLRCGCEILSIDGALGTATSTQEAFSAGMIVVASGWRSPSLAGTRPGKGVKGQAALLQAEAPNNMPVIQMPHLYIVQQPGGTVAIGSTSEPDWTHAEPDQALEDVISRARTLCPSLANAPVIERWSGIRPKPPGREPTIGRVPGTHRLYLASGGYKIGLGIGHRVGEVIASDLAGSPSACPFPDDFRPEMPEDIRP